MARFCFQVLVHLILIFVTSKCEDTPTVSATKGGNVTLACLNSNKVNGSYRVRWMKQQKNTEATVIFVWPTNNLNAKRVTWEADGNGRMSLHLKKLQMSDEGLYSCEVWQGWDRVLVNNIFLRVRECKILRAVSATPNSRTTLNIPLTLEEHGTMSGSWSKIKGNNFVAPDCHRVQKNDTSLTILSVNVSDGGWYRCEFVLEKTKSCFDIQLQIKGNSFTHHSKIVQTTMTMKIVTTTTSSPATTAGTHTGPSRKNESNVTLVAVVISTICGLMIATIVGVFICYRHTRKEVTRQPAVVLGDTDGYENVTLTFSSDSANEQRVNSFYHCQDDTLYTFS